MKPSYIYIYIYIYIEREREREREIEREREGKSFMNPKNGINRVNQSTPLIFEMDG